MANEFIIRKGYIALENSQISGSLSVTNAVTASFFTGSYLGDGSQLTGISAGFPFTGSAEITGSLIVTGSVSATSFIGDGSQLTGIPNPIPITATINNTNSPFTITSQSIVIVDSTNGDVTVNLPDLNTIVGTPAQRPILIYKNDYSQNVIFVTPSGSQLVNGTSQDIIVSIQIAVAYNPTNAGFITEGTSAQSLAELELFFLPLTQTGSLATTGSNVFIGNQTITGSLNVTGGITGSVSSASYVEYVNVANKPALVSGSSQVTYSGLTGVPVGIVSGSAQVTYSGLTGVPVGIVSGSAQISDFGIFATTGSNQFNGSQAITGSLTVTGAIVAQTLNVQQVTSSVVFSSGSNVFGNSLGNTQQFTGSVSITGSLNTSITAFGSAATVFLTSDNGTIRSRTAAQTLSDIAALPLVGGTLTGALNGTSAVFSELLTSNNTTGINATFNSTNASGGYINFKRSGTNIGYLGNSAQLGIGTLNAFELRADNDLFLTTVSGTLAIKSGGNVGIGTASPTNPLHIASNTVSQLNVTALSGNTNAQINLEPKGTGIALIGPADNVDFAFRTNATTRLTIASTGAATFSSSVTAGDTIQSSTFFRSNTPTTNSITIGVSANANYGYIGNSNFWGIRTGTAGDFNIDVNNSSSPINVFKITQAGNVGIGTTAPSCKLDVYSGASGVVLNLQGVDAYNAETAILMTSGRAKISGILESSGGTPGSILAFSTMPNGGSITERMRITSDGNQINYGNIFLNQTAVGIVNANATSIGINGIYNMSRLSGAGLIHIQFGNGGNIIGSVTSTTVSTSYNTTSDYRLKKDLQEINGLEKVQAIKVYDYKWIGQEIRMDGVLAHELAEVLPYAVHGEKDELNEDGTDKMQGVDYSKIVPILIKAIQELKTEIDSLKNQMQ